MKTLHVVVIAGNGIGKEVMPEGMRVLKTAARIFTIRLEFTVMEWASCDYYITSGTAK